MTWGEENDLAYVCMRCHRQIEFATVSYMSNIDNGQFSVSHTCVCTPGHIFDRTFKVHHDCIKRLLGHFRPVLPYQAAEGEPLPLRAHHERRLAIFRWECEMLESVDDLLLFSTRPLQASPPTEPAP